MSVNIPQNLTSLLNDFGIKVSKAYATDISEINDIQDLEAFLQKYFGDEMFIVDKTIEILIPNKEGFTSTRLLKIDLKLQRSISLPTENIYVIAKTPIFDMPIDWTYILKKEIFLYSHVKPLYKRFEMDLGICKTETIANILPKFYGSRMSLNYDADAADKDAAILLENVEARGYHLMDSKVGLDFEHATIALKTLARFHALGVCGRLKFFSDFETIKNSKWIENPVNHKVIDVTYLCFVESIKQYTRFNKHIETITKMMEREYGGWKYESVRHDLWTTIVHNDFWTNNIMFHHDEAGKVDDIKIIDYQLYVLADIFVDLSYFVFTSLDDDVKMNRLDEVLDIYYISLLCHLKKLGIDIKEYTKRRFNERFKQVAASNFLRIAVMLNLFTVDNGADRQKLFVSLMTGKGNDLYYKRLEQLFTIYEQKDWFH